MTSIIANLKQSFCILKLDEETHPVFFLRPNLLTISMSIKYIQNSRLTSLKMLTRGKTYFEEGRVELKNISHAYVEASVSGTKKYTVILKFENKKDDSVFVK